MRLDNGKQINTYDGCTIANFDFSHNVFSIFPRDVWHTRYKEWDDSFRGKILFMKHCTQSERWKRPFHRGFPPDRLYYRLRNFPYARDS